MNDHAVDLGSEVPGRVLVHRGYEFDTDLALVVRRLCDGFRDRVGAAAESRDFAEGVVERRQHEEAEGEHPDGEQQQPQRQRAIG